jgi:hypothetical protein
MDWSISQGSQRFGPILLRNFVGFNPFRANDRDKVSKAGPLDHNQLKTSRLSPGNSRDPEHLENETVAHAPGRASSTRISHNVRQQLMSQLR